MKESTTRLSVIRRSVGRRLLLLRRRGSALQFAMTLALLFVGVMAIYSATDTHLGRSANQLLWLKQLAWSAVGLTLYAIVAAMDYRVFVKYSPFIYLGALALLVVVLVAGPVINNARRWLDFGPVTFQPSEMAKLALLLLLLLLIAADGASPEKRRILALGLLVTALPMGLVIKQPDLGTALVFLPIALATMLVGGVRLKYVALICGVGLAVAVLTLSVVFRPDWFGLTIESRSQYLSAIGIRQYHLDRIDAFLDPASDPFGRGYNVLQSKIAVGSGGMWGKGFRNGTQNILGFLPMSVAPTDFIFSVIAEEFGFVGSVTILCLFMTLLFGICSTGWRTGDRKGDRCGRALCAGVAALFFSHVVVNIGMTIGLFPIIGLPLPLVSYGGTAMVVMMTALGLVQSVHIHLPRPV